MGNIQYRILRFHITRRGEIVKQLHKLPVNLAVCTGYLANVLEVSPLPIAKPEVGLLSLEFNSKKDHVLNDVVGFENSTEAKLDFQLLDVELCKGEILHCLYVDRYPASLQFRKYTVSIYLRCTSLVKCNTHD